VGSGTATQIIQPGGQFYKTAGFLIVRVFSHLVKLLPNGLVFAMGGKLSPSYSYLRSEYDGRRKRTTTRWTLGLPAAGCEWDRKDPKNGCTFCAFREELDLLTFGGYQYPASVFNKLVRAAYRAAKTSKPEVLVLYNGGNFLNEREVPVSTQLLIADLVGKGSTLNELYVESLPQFITAERVTPIVERLRGKRLTVALGWESSNDFVRQAFINKGMPRRMFLEKAALLKKLGGYPVCYAFIKPLGLSEHDAVEDAVDTVKDLANIGIDEIQIEAATVQGNETPMAKAYHLGKYRPPWIWSVIEVVLRTHHLSGRSFIYLGWFSDEPKPKAVPSNWGCDECREKLLASIQRYRETYDIKHLKGLSCTCKDEWRREIEEDKRSSARKLATYDATANRNAWG